MSSYEAITTVGGLLPSDLLERVRAGDKDLEGTSPESYGLVPGERINDHITRSWNRLRGVWESYVKQLDALPESDRGTTLARQRWCRPLLDELGFAGLPTASGLEVDGKQYPISHDWVDHVPIHIMGARIEIDRRSAGVAGAAAMSPHGLVQEFLNRSTDHLWGIVTNGSVLRVLRDNASLTKQAYVEFDLQAMFDGELFSDFAVFWLTCHRTRFEGDPPEKCLLECWALEAAHSGTRALDKLRDGVEKAITSLGAGFVAHPANTELRDAIRTGEVTTTDLQRQVLRIVYRLLFLLVAESRDLIHPPDTDPTAVERYRRFYSIDRLRTLAARRRGGPHDDLWESTSLVMRGLWHEGVPALGLSPLSSALWSPDSIVSLFGARLDNAHFLDAIRALCFVRDDEARIDRAVDYRNLGAEELGSVYESLLELHAEVDVDARTFALATAAGSERKTTGSYYTPTSLITELLGSALDPVLDEASGMPDPERAILGLKIIDPAVGSGHFLIAAAHRIAGRLASIRAGGGEPAPHELRSALRDVVGRCLHGIDINPMAVELCKVSLWLEATEPGKPLNFLDHRIVCGNALLGTTPRLLGEGIPDDAFKALEGDDNKVVSELKKHNRAERKGQGVLGLFDDSVAAAAKPVVAAFEAIDAVPNDTADQISRKAQLLAELAQSPHATRAKLAADAWCAAFVATKAVGEPPITTATVRQLLEDPRRVSAEVLTRIQSLADEYRFLHLHLAFPDAIYVPDDPDTASNERTGWNGGFNAVLGNPPWDAVEFRAEEFFAASRPDIAAAPRKSVRDQMIDGLRVDDPALYESCRREQRRVDNIAHLLKHGGVLTNSSEGSLNTYSLFTELADLARAGGGRAGLVVQSGVVTDASSNRLFKSLATNEAIRRCVDFKNRLGIFPGVDRRTSFSLLTLGAGSNRAEYFFGAERLADLAEVDRWIFLSGSELVQINPTTGVFPPFRSGRDASLVSAAHNRFPILFSTDERVRRGWDVARVGFPNIADDSDKFSAVPEVRFTPTTDSLPVFESKMIHHFDHRFADIVDEEGHTTELRSDEHESPLRLARPRRTMRAADLQPFLGERPIPVWMIGWRDTARNDDVRTVIPTLLPRSAPPRNNLPVLLVDASPTEALTLVGVLSSFVLDYIGRQKIAGAHVTRGHMEQLPVPTRADLDRPRVGRHTAIEVLGPRVLELTYTAWDLAGLSPAQPPFLWDARRRPLLRAEIDAFCFHLYGMARDDLDHIMDSFPIVRRKDEAQHGEYRTKGLILDAYNRMADAVASGQPYETILDPPPAHPSLTHDPTSRPGWADWYLKGADDAR